jgi:CheY-like chemotaxis protein
VAGLDTRFSTAGDVRPAGRVVSEHYPAPRVLLVDAHADTRDLYVVWLTQHGFSVRVAGSGDEAVAIARAEALDVIVTEMMLPDGGPPLVRRLRAVPAAAEAVLVVLTTQNAASLREQALEAGADSYLVKPCGAPRLGEAMASVSRARFRRAIPTELRQDAVLRAAQRAFAIRERVAGSGLPRADPIAD